MSGSLEPVVMPAMPHDALRTHKGLTRRLQSQNAGFKAEAATVQTTFVFYSVFAYSAVSGAC